ncbi:MAG: glycosyltransferase family 2 protein [Planctomycetota bacterium]|jgi:GT2 family glycosyltransferase
MPTPLPISVVIPTLDRPGEVAGCLESLERHCDWVDPEVIVVDQSDSTRTRDVCAGNPRVRYLHNEQLGISVNRNLGAREASRDWLVFADDDGRFGEGWGEAAARAMVCDDAPDLLLGRVVDQNLKRRFAVAESEERCELTPRNVWLGSGPSVHVRRDLFARLGGYDETLGVGTPWGATEEVDLFLRALLAGARGVFEPAMIVHHRCHPDVGTEAERLRYGYGRGDGAFIRKHLFGPAGRQILPMAAHLLFFPLMDLWYCRRRAAERRVHLAALKGRWSGLLTWRRPRRAARAGAQAASSRTDPDRSPPVS